MTPFGRSLEGAADQPKRMSAAKSNSNRPLMNAVKPAAPTRGRIAEQVPAFAAIGLIGYVVDATITFLGAKYLGLSPELARPPGFIVAKGGQALHQELFGIPTDNDDRYIQLRRVRAHRASFEASVELAAWWLRQLLTALKRY